MTGLPFRSTPIFPTEAAAGGGGGGSVNSVTAGNAGITIGGTAADPTVGLAAHGTTYHTGNVFPTTSDQTLGDYSIVFGDRTAPSTPSAGTCAFFLSAATGYLTVKYDTGTTVALDGAGGGGTVTSVALTAPSIFSVSGSPVTTSGTLAITLATQVANRVFAGPTTGADAAPTFRALVADDVPSLDAAKIGSGTLAVARGGTNIGSYTTGDVLYASGATTLSKLAIGTAGLPLIVSGGVPAWNALGTAGGGTGQTSYTTGDLLYAVSASVLNKLAIGTAGHVLTVSGGAPVWASVTTALDVLGSTRGAILYRGASGWAILAPGTSGHVLTSNGAGADPSYQAGGGGGGTMPQIVLRPFESETPASNPATLDTRNAHPVLDYDGTTAETSVWTAVLPASYAGGGLTVDVYVAFTSATSGSAYVQVAFERDAVNDLDIDSDSFASFKGTTVSANATSGKIAKATISFTDGAEMDSILAGEPFRVKVGRDPANAGDDITTDMELLVVVISET